MASVTVQNRFVRTLGISDPATGADGPDFFTTEAIDVRELRAVLENPASPPGTPSVDWDIVIDSARDAVSPTAILSSTATTTDTGSGDAKVPADFTSDPFIIPAGRWVWLVLGTVTAGGDAPLHFSVTLTGFAQ